MVNTPILHGRLSPCGFKNYAILNLASSGDANGRKLPSHAQGHGFDPPRVHDCSIKMKILFSLTLGGFEKGGGFAILE
jgi:hypothetical protein